MMPANPPKIPAKNARTPMFARGDDWPSRLKWPTLQRPMLSSTARADVPMRIAGALRRDFGLTSSGIFLHQRRNAPTIIARKNHNTEMTIPRMPEHNRARYGEDAGSGFGSNCSDAAYPGTQKHSGYGNS